MVRIKNESHRLLQNPNDSKFPKTLSAISNIHILQSLIGLKKIIQYIVATIKK